MTNPTEAVICPIKSHFETPRQLRLRHCEYTWRPIVASKSVAAVQPINSVIIGVYGARLSEGFAYASASAPDAVFVFGR